MEAERTIGDFPMGHRVTLEFEGGSTYVRLICPEKGCEPASTCGYCHRDLNDPESEPCYDCKGAEGWGDCWLQSWFDDAPEELLRGRIEIPIEAEWSADHPIINLRPDPLRSKIKEEVEGARREAVEAGKAGELDTADAFEHFANRLEALLGQEGERADD